MKGLLALHWLTVGVMVMLERRKTVGVEEAQKVQAGSANVVERFPVAQGGAANVVERIPVAQGGAANVVERFPVAQGGAANVVERFPVAQGGAANVVERFPVARSTTERKPTVVLLAGMHGDETLGVHLLQRWVDHLDQHARRVPALKLVVVPVMNPSGFARRTRATADGVDLNRDFPVTKDEWGTKEVAVETRAVLDLLEELRGQTVATINVHGGALCVVHPQDDDYGRKGRSLEATGPRPPKPRKCTRSLGASKSVSEALARVYAMGSEIIMQDETFPGGVVKGLDWYPAHGTFQDCAHRMFGVPSITVEASKVKHLTSSNEIEAHVADHTRALLATLAEIERRVVQPLPGVPAWKLV